MPDHGHGHHGPPDTSRGFEQTDLEFGAISKGVLFYFIFTGAIGVVVFLGFLLFHQAEIPSQDLAVVPSAPYPLLQNNITDRTDIWNLRSREDFLLHTYTFDDPSKKTVTVPIDLALDEVSAAGPSALSSIPAIPKPPQTQAGSATIANPDLPTASLNSKKPENNPPEAAPKRKPMPAPLQGSLRTGPSEGGAK